MAVQGLDLRPATHILKSSARLPRWKETAAHKLVNSCLVHVVNSGARLPVGAAWRGVAWRHMSCPALSRAPGG